MPDSGCRLPTNATGGCVCGAIRYKIKFPRNHDFAANSATCLCTACRKQSGSLFLHLHAIPISHFTCTAAVSALGDYSCSPGCHRLFCKICGSFIAWQQDPKTRRGIHDAENDHLVETRQAIMGIQNVTMTDEDESGTPPLFKMEGCSGPLDSLMEGVQDFTNGGSTSTPASSSTDATNVTIGREDDTEHQTIGTAKLEAKSQFASSIPQSTSPCGSTGNWQAEGEVEICVGTLDEQFLVGKRDKCRNVVPNTGFGSLVAHPQGRVLWAENEIEGVTTGLRGERWKYGMDAGVKIKGPSFDH